MRITVSLLAMFIADSLFTEAPQKKPVATTPVKNPAQSGKPNSVIIWCDDIGQSNISAYSHGVMGYKNPNFDRVAKEGVTFTDYCTEQICAAGRTSFITGQCGLRNGLTKFWMPGDPIGIQKEGPAIAGLLKGQGFATGQFGKNHLGDCDEQLPTMHGFIEFYSNLYHLNAEEETEYREYPTEKDFPGFRQTFGPGGVLHTWGNADGAQKIEKTGPLTNKRMKTIDDVMQKMQENQGSK